jgi:hypothetical protein
MASVARYDKDVYSSPPDRPCDLYACGGHLQVSLHNNYANVNAQTASAVEESALTSAEIHKPIGFNILPATVGGQPGASSERIRRFAVVACFGHPPDSGMQGAATGLNG